MTFVPAAGAVPPWSIATSPDAIRTELPGAVPGIRRPGGHVGTGGWATLRGPARAYRLFHAVWSVAGLAALGYVWICALARRRDPYLAASVAFLLIEGGGLVVGGGDCPMGPLQARIGDPVPIFELVLPPRAAKAAVPILAAASIAGFLGVALRPPGRSRSSRHAARRG